MKNIFTKKLFLKILGIVAVIAVIAGMLYIYDTSKPSNPGADPSDGSYTQLEGKDVTIQVIDAGGNLTEYAITTHAQYLKQVMNEAQGLEYTEKDGMVMTVNGIRADYLQDGAYWAFYINGEYCSYGISEQPVNNGDLFSIEYTKA